MSNNPFANALAATLYISAVASVMYYGSHYANQTNSIVAPIALMSLFTLSAAVMAYLFIYGPAQLYFAGKKKQGVDLFLKTVAVFAGVTALLLGLLFSGWLP